MIIRFFILLWALILCACSIDDEYAEKIIEPATLSPIEQLAGEFSLLASKCIEGESERATELAALYRDTLDENHLHPLLYQDRTLTQNYERCLQKAQSDGVSIPLNAFIHMPFRCAVISSRFYRAGDHVNGAYWLRRLTNLVGLKTGYGIAGEIFIKEEATFAIGTKLLAEAARLGNQEARMVLFKLVHPDLML